jgi:hypothetical protein
MWRPLVFQGPWRVGCVHRFEALRERIESCTQRRYLLLLPIDDIAELDVGALQERDLGFDSLNFIAGHFDSVPIRGAHARALCPANNQNQTGGFPVPIISASACSRASTAQLY